MSLLRKIDHLFHLRPSVPATPPAAHQTRSAARRDQFEVAARPRVDLGRAGPASSGSDAAFVKALYRGLLDREPDPAGFASHLRGLQAGMSRDEIRNVFLTSPEFRQKQVGAAAPPAAPVAPEAPAPAPAATPMSANIAEAFPQFPNLNSNSPVSQLREVIRADVLASRGSEATDADYSYWMGKFQGENDSGFVTSGQMTAMDYWHKRLLGWQAGGADAPKYGPYSSNPSAPVPGIGTPPAAPVAPAPTPVGTPMSANITEAFPQFPNLDRNSPVSQLREVIRADVLASRGSGAVPDYSYWLEKFQGENDSGFVTSGQMTAMDYWHKRLLGWQAEGADRPPYGPYSADPSAPVPG